MQQLSQTLLNNDISAIQILHARLGNDLALSLAYHTGNHNYLRHLSNKNILVSDYIEILKRYRVLGDDTVCATYNVLTVSDIQSIIDDCYRELEQYNT